MSVMDLPAREIAARVRAGLDPVTVAQAALERVAARNPDLNALCHVSAENVLAQAEAVGGRLAAEEDLPLAGVPVVIKDNIWVADTPVTQGSRLYAGFVAPRDAKAVERLRRAGAVILGMGACSEFACKGVTDTPLHGVTRHPLDPSLTPGGSSGGPAVAVAARMAPLALGTDAGGSSRRPPAHVGIVGFKPTQDAIPYGPGFAEPFWNTSVLAPMAADVADAALMFEVLAQEETALAPARTAGDLRIAFAPSMGLGLPLSGAVAPAMGAALAALRAAGLEIAEESPRWPEGVDPAAVMPLQAAGLAMLHGARWQAEPGLFDPDLGRQIEAGLALCGTDVARALEASRLMRDTLRAFLGRYDLILSATSSAQAWPATRLGPETIGGRPAGPRDHAAFTPQFNHAGLPAISIPCGAPSGLPVGLQIGAGAGQDRTLLAAAARFETIFHEAGLWPAPHRA